MKFDRPQAVSFKPVDDGEYIGVLVGFSYIGIHATREWGDKPKIMLRWELHSDAEPYPILKDDEDLIHVVTQSFPATIRGDSSWLYKCLQAHGIVVPGGGCADSHEWYGKAAILTIEGNPGSRGDRVFLNVTNIDPLKSDVTIVPVLKFEHWEPEDENPPPVWARAMIDRSSDVYHRTSQTSQTPGATGNQGQRSGQGQGSRQGPGQGQGPSRPTSPVGQRSEPAGYRPPNPADDEDDIPFFDHMITPSGDDSEAHRSWIAKSPVSNVVR